MSKWPGCPTISCINDRCDTGCIRQQIPENDRECWGNDVYNSFMRAVAADRRERDRVRSIDMMSLSHWGLFDVLIPWREGNVRNFHYQMQLQQMAQASNSINQMAKIIPREESFKVY